MRTLLVLAVLIGAARADELGAADAEALHGNVLVWHDATLYTEPSDGAAAIHVAALAGARKDKVGGVMPMHVVATRDGFVEVEPVGDVDCTWSHLAISDDVARLRLFVKRADLAPVLAKPYDKAFPDGTRIALRPGVAVIPTTNGSYAVGVRGGELVAELPTASVGHSYTPDRSKAAPTIADHEYELAPNTEVTLGDRSFPLDGRRAQSVERRGATSLVSIESRCAVIQVAAPTKSVRVVDEDESSIESGSGVGVLDLRDRDYIPAGTILSTPSGHPIAIAAKPIYVMAHARCFERHVRVESLGELLEPKDNDDKLRLCAPAAKVVHERMRSYGSANGTTHR